MQPSHITLQIIAHCIQVYCVLKITCFVSTLFRRLQYGSQNVNMNFKYDWNKDKLLKRVMTNSQSGTSLHKQHIITFSDSITNIIIQLHTSLPHDTILCTCTSLRELSELLGEEGKCCTLLTMGGLQLEWWKQITIETGSEMLWTYRYCHSEYLRQKSELLWRMRRISSGHGHKIKGLYLSVCPSI